MAEETRQQAPCWLLPASRVQGSHQVLAAPDRWYTIRGTPENPHCKHLSDAPCLVLSGMYACLLPPKWVSLQVSSWPSHALALYGYCFGTADSAQQQSPGCFCLCEPRLDVMMLKRNCFLVTVCHCLCAMQEENFSEALSNASKVWAPPRICELLLWGSMQILLSGVLL